MDQRRITPSSSLPWAPERQAARGGPAGTTLLRWEDRISRPGKGDDKIPTHADVAQLVEHHLAKVGVAGSNPVVRSNHTAFYLHVSVGPPNRSGLLELLTTTRLHENRRAFASS